MNEDRDRQSALERARKMKAFIPDATVRGQGRVRDLTVEQIADWILHERSEKREVAR